MAIPLPPGARYDARTNSLTYDIDDIESMTIRQMEMSIKEVQLNYTMKSLPPVFVEAKIEQRQERKQAVPGERLLIV